ncbi:MAG: hypothetical protein ACXVJ7_00045 [Acidimicrobiia bacterium]
MTKVRVFRMSSGEYDVRVESGASTRTHRVLVGHDLLSDLHAGPDDSERVVVAAFDYLDESDDLASLGSFVTLDRLRSQQGFVEGVRRRIA